MPRRLCALLLLLAIFCQTLALFSPPAVAERAAELEHLALHGQGAGHHHHDDGMQAVHLDEADGAVPHLHADAGPHTAGLPAAGWAMAGAARPLSPTGKAASRAPSPPPDSLLRPPKHSA